MVTGFSKSTFGLYDLSRGLIKLADDNKFNEAVRKEKELFAEAARSIQGDPAFLVDMRKRLKATARATGILTAQASRVLEYRVTPLAEGEDISGRVRLWTKDEAANSLATAACQGALDAQMQHEGITRDSIRHLLGAQPQRELDGEPDAAAPASAADDGPGSAPDGASGDHAPDERSPSGDGRDASDGDSLPDVLEPLEHALPPRAGGAPDDGASALPADGCVRARVPPCASLA